MKWFYISLEIFIIILFSVVTKIAAKENKILTKDLRYTLPNGDLMPYIGIGCGDVTGYENIKEILDNAFAAGYRLIDTAAKFGNEEDVGKALKELLPKHNLTRKDIFITSKLAPNADSYGKHAYQALKDSTRKLGTDYVDLYLIHFPGIDPTPDPNLNFSKLREKSWKRLVKGKKDGLARNIGVSNYNIRHLTQLLNKDHGEVPVINQVEWHPEHHDDDLRHFCVKANIAVQAYFALGGATNKTKLLENTEVQKIAVKLAKTPAQVLLRWSVQQNVLVIPKSKGRKHLEENLDLNFEIPKSDMDILSNIKQVGKSIWNPDSVI